MTEFLLSIMTLSHGLILGANLNEVYTSYFSVGITDIFFILVNRQPLQKLSQRNNTSVASYYGSYMYMSIKLSTLSEAHLLV